MYKCNRCNKRSNYSSEIRCARCDTRTNTDESYHSSEVVAQEFMRPSSSYDYGSREPFSSYNESSGSYGGAGASDSWSSSSSDSSSSSSDSGSFSSGE